MLKLKIPTALRGKFIGQTAYTTDGLKADGSECAAQKYVALAEGGRSLAVINDSIYGFSCKSGVLYLSLVRSPAYAAHPIREREILKQDRYTSSMDQGEHNYRFVLTADSLDTLENKALFFHEEPCVINVFPSGEGTLVPPPVTVSNPVISMSVFKKSEITNGFVIRLVNNSSQENKTIITVGGVSRELKFGKYEIKTILFTCGKLEESKELVI